MTIQPPSDAELAELADLAARATPGPWHVRHLDDEHAMSLVAVSTEPDTGLGERWPNFDHATMIAATLVQQPRYVDTADKRWNVNATFIAAARTAVPASWLRSHGSGTYWTTRPTTTLDYCSVVADGWDDPPQPASAAHVAISATVWPFTSWSPAPSTSTPI